MAQEEQHAAGQPRNYAKWIWGGIICLFLLMVGAMFMQDRDSDSSRSMARARHILVRFDPADPTDRQRSLELISNLRDRIQAGEDFARLAREYSDDAVSAARGGDLGYNPKGAFQDTFEQTLWHTPVGEISEIIVTTHGFHILQVRVRTLSRMDEYQQEIERKADELLSN